jgi:hypothetical protein
MKKKETHTNRKNIKNKMRKNVWGNNLLTYSLTHLL